MSSNIVVKNIKVTIENTDFFFEEENRLKKKKISLILEIIFSLLTNSLLLFLIGKFFHGKIFHLKTLRFDFHSFIKLIFFALVLSIMTILAIDVCVNFFNLIVVNGVEKKSFIQGKKNVDEISISILNSGFVIFVDSMMPFIFEKIQSFFTYMKNFVYENCFKKLENFANEIIEYFKNNDHKLEDLKSVIKEFFEFCKNIFLRFIINPSVNFLQNKIEEINNSFLSIVPDSIIKINDSFFDFLETKMAKT